jgi:hypothetical protein
MLTGTGTEDDSFMVLITILLASYDIGYCTDSVDFRPTKLAVSKSKFLSKMSKHEGHAE